MASRTRSRSGRRKAVKPTPKPASNVPAGLVELGKQSYYLRGTHRTRFLTDSTQQKSDLDKPYGDTGLFVAGLDRSGNLVLRRDHRSGDLDKAVFYTLSPGAVLDGGQLVQDAPVKVEFQLMSAYVKKVPKELLEPMVANVSLDHLLSSGGGVYRGTNYVAIGDPGVGKSTIVMEYAAALHAQGKKVLRIEAEMTRIDMVGYVARFPQFGDIPTLFLADYSDSDPRKVITEALKQGWDLVVIDSASELTDDLQETVNLSQRKAESFVIDTMVRHNNGQNDAGIFTSFLVVQQVGKGGKFVGSNKWKHNTTGMIEFRIGKRSETYAYVEKNRRGFRYRRLVFELRGSEVVYRTDLAEAEELAQQLERENKARIDESNRDFAKDFGEGLASSRKSRRKVAEAEDES